MLSTLGGVALSLLGCHSSGNDDVGFLQGGLHATTLLSTSTPSACWVKDFESTTPDADFDAATQEVQAVLSQWESASGLRFLWQGRCGAKVGSDYPGDIRILWNEKQRGSGYPIPGCSQVHGNGNWGGFPGFPKQCQWNAAFAVNQPINNYLHESGHTVGFLHEHQRSDNVEEICGSAHSDDDQNLLTPYDKLSVMHYVATACGAPGNLGSTGLSEYDRLGIEIAYPKGEQLPISVVGAMAFDGGFVFRTDAAGTLVPEWYQRGALATVFSNFEWTLGSSVTNDLTRSVSGSLASSPILATMQFDDPWGNPRTGSVQVLASDAAHTAMVMAVTSS